MAYIGNDLAVAYPSYRNIDDISASFNGSTTSFALLINGVAPVPQPLNSQQCLISVGGVLQRPDDTGSEGFRLSGGNIIFSSAPATSEDFFGVVLAGADYVNAGGNFPDGQVGSPSITFDQDTDTGFYRSGSGAVSFTSNGVGTATLGSASFTAPSFIPTSSTVPTNGVYLPAANSVAIATNSAHRIRIDSSGNVGIGTTSPIRPLDVLKSTDGAIANFGTSAGGGQGILLGVDTASSTTYIQNNTSASYALNFQVGGSERARIDSSGRLLVGTSTSLGKFYNSGSGVDHSFQIETTGAYAQSWVSHGTSAGFGAHLTIGRSRGTSAGSVTVVQQNDSLGHFSFQGADGTEFVEAAKIEAYVDGTPGANDMPGRLVFSTTRDGQSSPTEALRLNKDGWISCQAAYDVTTGTSPNFVVGGTGIFQRSTSSAKYKTQIEDVEFAYSEVLLSCRPVWYRSTCQVDCPDHSYWGFIAEEVAAIDPRLVQWKTISVSYDEKGQKVETPCDPEPEGVAYDRFVPHLLSLIKRQKEQIEAMEARLSALEAS